jgi:hypothetical protein
MKRRLETVHDSSRQAAESSEDRTEESSAERAVQNTEIEDRVSILCAIKL